MKRLVFGSNGSKYSVDVDYIEDILRDAQVRMTNFRHPCILGSLETINPSIPVFDFEKLLSNKPMEMTQKSGVIIVNNKYKFGIAVESIDSVLDIDYSDILDMKIAGLDYSAVSRNNKNIISISMDDLERLMMIRKEDTLGSKDML